MTTTEKEPKFDFSDASRTDSQKWKMYSKELSYLVIVLCDLLPFKSFYGPIYQVIQPNMESR